MINPKLKTSKQRLKQRVLVAVVFTVALIFLMIFLRPVKIVSAVREWNEGYFFVDNFPITNSGKIAWWQDNKELLKEKYNMPFIGSDKEWTVLIGEAGDGFQFLPKTDKADDYLCFDSLKPGANCAEKKWLLWISHINQTDTRYTTDDARYIQRGVNAEIKRVAD